MKARCLNSSNDAYANYGGRGITICPAWRNNFETFLAHIGRRPTPQHSIDRFPDNNGNYEPGNVRWATAGEQANNQRSNRLVTFNGQMKTTAEWSRLTGIHQVTLRDRLDTGWSVDRALTGGRYSRR
jgi:hypothetical protein